MVPHSRQRPTRSSSPAPIFVRCQGVNEYVKIPIEDLPPNPYDLIYLLKVETAPREKWRHAAASYFRTGRPDAGVTVLEHATSEDVDTMLRGGPDENENSCSRLALLASLAGAHIMRAENSTDPRQRADALRQAADVFSRADKIDLDDPAIWAARGWAEFAAGKSAAANWFDNARDKKVVLGAVGLAALHLNRSKPVEPGRKDPVFLLVDALRSYRCPAGVWTGLAYALFKEGKIRQARLVSKRAIWATKRGTPSERLEALYILSRVELNDWNKQSMQQVFPALREAYKFCGGDQDARILTLLASMFFKGGNFEIAHAFGKRAVVCSNKLAGSDVSALHGTIRTSTRVEALFELARAQHHLKMYVEATENFEKMKLISETQEAANLKINPGMLLRLGLLKLSTGRKEDETFAQECLEKVLKSCGDRCGIAKRALGVILGRKILVSLKKGRPNQGEHFDRAVNLLKKGLEENANDSPAQLVYAGLMEEHFPKKAIAAHRKAIEITESKEQEVDMEIWNNLSCLLARSGHLEEAEQLVKEKIEESEKLENLTLTYNLARVTEMKGLKKEAEKMYKDRFEKGSQHFDDVRLRLASIAMESGERDEEAEKLLKEALTVPSTKSIAAAMLSNLYTSQKHFERAQKILEEHRNECDYLALSLTSFMHRFLDSLDSERRNRFLVNHIGHPLVSMLKRNPRNAIAVNGVGVYFAESKMMKEARDAFQSAGSAPNPEQTARVNLAHAQVYLAIKDLQDSARFTGRPSPRTLSNARGLYDQANKLYSDALDLTPLDGSKKNLQCHCELLLYCAWTWFEAREFEKSVDYIARLLHLVPFSSTAWYNLGLALLESATERSIKGSARLHEMQKAKTEFEGSRSALQRSAFLARRYLDPISRSQVDRRNAMDVERYVRQQAKKHDVALLNAQNDAEDRETKRKDGLEKLRKMQEKEQQRELEKEQARIKKEKQLLEAFKESEKKLKQYGEEHRRRMEKDKANEDDMDEEYNDDSPNKPSKKKRKKKKDNDSSEQPAKKAKSSRSSGSKKEDGSGSEYSDLPDDNGLDDDEITGAENREESSSKKRSTPEPSDDGEEQKEKGTAPKRKRIISVDDEDEE